MTLIAPGATIGILGGGQLGRMTALAAISMGYDVHVLDPDPECPARAIAGRLVTAPFADADAAADLARGCDVVTLEIEKIPLPTIAAAARHAPVRPGAGVLGVVQDRGVQKAWLVEHGFPLGPYRPGPTAEACTAAVRTLRGPCFVKSCRGGYDGRGQVLVQRPEEAADAFAKLGGGECVVERALDLVAELSVFVARRPSGEICVFPPALNHHIGGILAWSVIPGGFEDDLARRAREIGRGIAAAMQLEGVLAVELFLLADGTLYVNELAPRPHNSFHHTEMGAVTSQFEQTVRAVCDLPLGSGDIMRPTAIANLLGEIWLGPTPPPFAEALALPGVRLHLYGKRVAKRARKMGHVSATAATSREALRLAVEARDRLAPAAEPRWTPELERWGARD